MPMPPPSDPIDSIVAETLDDLFDLLAQNLDGLPPDIVVAATEKIQAAFCDGLSKWEWDPRRARYPGGGGPQTGRQLPRDEPRKRNANLLAAVIGGLADNDIQRGKLHTEIDQTQARLTDLRSRQSATGAELAKELARAGITEPLRKGRTNA